MNPGQEHPLAALPHARFEPVPLPSLPPGEISAGRLEPVLREWACSPPIRALAEASGWEWPQERDTGTLLVRLDELSNAWDFRDQRERNFIESAPAEVNGRVVSNELVIPAARALGLVESGPVPQGRFSAVAVLCGLITACVNRTHLAAHLLRGGLDAALVVVLGGHRELGGREPGIARELGFGELFDEADAVVAATRLAFGLGDPELAQDADQHPAAWQNALWAASARYRWPKGDGLPAPEVLIVPSADPARRRVNTADQLRYWAAKARLGADDRILLVTSQIYVPFQQLDAVRVLGLEHGCSVSCCGVDGSNAYLPMRAFGGRDYLQEIRSALRAASALMAAAHQAGY